MTRGIRTIYALELNIVFGSKFLCISPEEGHRTQRPKRLQYGKNDEDNNPSDVISVFKRGLVIKTCYYILTCRDIYEWG